MGLLFAVIFSTIGDEQALRTRHRSTLQFVGDVAGDTINVKGRLQNSGSNYFNDRRLLLIVEGKEPFIVQGWLPMHVAKGPSNSDGSPATLSDFLDKNVELTGNFEIRPVKGLGLQRVFVVVKAKVVN